MQAYTLGSRSNQLFMVLLTSVVGIPFLAIGVLWPLGLLTVNGKAQATDGGDIVMSVIGIAAGLVSLHVARLNLAGYPYRAQITSGYVEFQMLIGRTVVPMHDLRSVRLAVRSLHPESQDSREFRLTWSGGVVPMLLTEEAARLVKDLVAADPALAPAGT